MNPKPITVRIPPSPTGHLHLGTARTALFNYLFAKKNNGNIIFRWEDTDKERSKTEYETEILDGLEWMGLDFRKECTAFYRQTENHAFHTQWIQKLWESKKIFPCFTTQDEIQAQRSQAEKDKQGFVFWSPFRETASEELQQKMDSGVAYVWRIRTPKNQEIIFQDIVRGEIKTNTNTIGDFVIARTDGSALYMLANVLDDSSQGVTHIIRGEDHISNTPKQIILYNAIGHPLPEFAHIPLVLDKNRKKLSKRNVDPDTCVLMNDFQAEGFLPEAVLNGLSLIGWNPKSTQELFTKQELIDAFDLANVQPGAAQYDFEKMTWFNAQWMKNKPTDELYKDYTDWNPNAEHTEKEKKAITVLKKKAKKMKDMESDLTYLLGAHGTTKESFDKIKMDAESIEKSLQYGQKMFKILAEKDYTPELIREKAIEIIKEEGFSNKSFLSPLRVALSGVTPSASPFEMAYVFGKKETEARIATAIQLLS
jgi:glutamyl-tRNA synthetase